MPVVLVVLAKTMGRMVSKYRRTSSRSFAGPTYGRRADPCAYNLNDEDSVSHRIFHPSSTVKCPVSPDLVPVNVISRTEAFS